MVYPVARGTGQLATPGFAAPFLGEHYRALQRGGAALLSGAILMLAVVNLARVQIGRSALWAGLAGALPGGYSSQFIPPVMAGASG